MSDSFIITIKGCEYEFMRMGEQLPNGDIVTRIIKHNDLNGKVYVRKGANHYSIFIPKQFVSKFIIFSSSFHPIDGKYDYLPVREGDAIGRAARRKGLQQAVGTGFYRYRRAISAADGIRIPVSGGATLISNDSFIAFISFIRCHAHLRRPVGRCFRA